MNICNCVMGCKSCGRCCQEGHEPGCRNEGRPSPTPAPVPPIPVDKPRAREDFVIHGLLWVVQEVVFGDYGNGEIYLVTGDELEARREQQARGGPSHAEVRRLARREGGAGWVEADR